MTGRILIYYKYDTMGSDRFFRGDRFIRKPIRRLLRGKPKIGGVDLVYLNLVAGLERLGVDYRSDVPFGQILPEDKVGVIGRDRYCLTGYRAENPILAGVAVAEHPMAWPTLFEEYPIARYVVHSSWVREVYERLYGPRVVEWAVGVDTLRWSPSPATRKSVDFLIYDKVRWNTERIHRAMVDPIKETLEREGLSSLTIRYGAYEPHDLEEAFDRCRALLFLCEHESQGLAYQQAMSAGLPVLAWDPGQWLDPWRFRYGDVYVKTTSVPFFDERCGTTFQSATDFPEALNRFMARFQERRFEPRAYMLEHLTLERSAQRYLDLLEAYT